MAFNVFFNVVQNEELRIKGIPWLCDKCHKDKEVLLRIRIDYETLVLCKKCLMTAKRLVTDKEKELKDESKSNIQPKKSRR